MASILLGIFFTHIPPFQTQIYDEDETGTVDGAMLIPVILGADKTTVSVATGHVEYHPLYLTIGNVTNALRRAHSNAVIPIGFLAIPKCKSWFRCSSFMLIYI